MIKQTSIKEVSEEIKHQPAHHTHLLLLTIMLALLGLLTVYSSSAFYAERTLGNNLYFIYRHGIHLLLGAFLFFVCSQFHYQNFQKLIFFMMLISFAGLLLVFIPKFSIKVYGARRWLDFGLFTFQPADFFKFAVMVWIADFTQRKSEHIHFFRRSLLPPLLVMILFALLLILQPDFGSVVLVFVCLLMVTLIAGVRVSHLIFILISFGGIAVALVLNSAYRFRRIKAFIDPWGDTGDVSYQLSNALIAYGGGGLFGRGLGNSLQKEFYLPQAHTDFIAAIMAEEVGLLGFVLFLSIYTLFIMKGFAITTQCKNEFGRNLGFGLTIMIAFQALFHICVTMGLLPTKGIGLPLISYGGSSNVMTLVMLGVLYNIGKQATSKDISQTSFFRKKLFDRRPPKNVNKKPISSINKNKRRYFNKRSR